MGNWQDKTDTEINSAVKLVLISKHEKETDFDKFFLNILIDSDLDYCNNPAFSWPIMTENGIAPLAENGRIYGATTDTYEYYEPHGNKIYSHEDKNPLRAAMIVYLMMNEANNATN